MTLLLVGCIKVGMNTTLDATILQCYYWQCPVSSSSLGLGVYGSIPLHLFWFVFSFIFSRLFLFYFILFYYKTLGDCTCDFMTPLPSSVVVLILKANCG